MTWLRNQLKSAPFGQLVHSVGIDPRVDRPAHQHHRVRNIRIVVGLHQRNRCHDRHRRLTNGNHMNITAKRPKHRDDVVDIRIEVEAPIDERHHARIDPIGDVNIVVGQERFHRAAQQCRIVPRHRRDDQQLRLWAARWTHERPFEMKQSAKRTLPDAFDVDRHPLAANGGRIDSPFRLAVAAGRTLEQLHCRRDRFSVGGVRERVGRILEKQTRGICKRARRIERGVAQFIEPVHRRREKRAAIHGERCRSAEFAYCHGVPPTLAAVRQTVVFHSYRQHRDKLFASGLQRERGR